MSRRRIKADEGDAGAFKPQQIFRESFGLTQSFGGKDLLLPRRLVCYNTTIEANGPQPFDDMRDALDDRPQVLSKLVQFSTNIHSECKGCLLAALGCPCVCDSDVLGVE